MSVRGCYVCWRENNRAKMWVLLIAFPGLIISPQALILSPGPEHFLPSLLSGVYACPEMWDSHCYIDTQVVPVDTQHTHCTADMQTMHVHTSYTKCIYHACIMQLIDKQHAHTLGTALPLLKNKQRLRKTKRFAHKCQVEAIVGWGGVARSP